MTILRSTERPFWLRVASLAAVAGLVSFHVQVATAALIPGDIAIIGYQADNPDEIAFVAMDNIAAGESINFTDHGWFAAGGFRTNEGTSTWTAPPGGLAAGTVVQPGLSSGPLFSTSGDQVFAYQGTEASPTLIYGLHSNGSTWDADATSSNTSALPATLVDGQTAVAIPEVDNFYYNGTTTGTRADLLTAIGTPGNWVTDNSRFDFSTVIPDSFDVTDAGDPPPPPPPPPPPSGGVAITEFMPDPTTTNDVTEYVELFNYGPTAVDLAGWTLKDDDSDNVVLPSISIGSGDAVVLTKDKATFEGEWFGSVPQANVYEVNFGFLANGADELRLLDPGNELAWALDYTDGDPGGDGFAWILTDTEWLLTDYGTIQDGGPDETGTLGYEYGADVPGLFTSDSGDTGSPGSTFHEAIPEPASFALLGLLALVGIRRRVG